MVCCHAIAPHTRTPTVWWTCLKTSYHGTRLSVCRFFTLCQPSFILKQMRDAGYVMWDRQLYSIFHLIVITLSIRANDYVDAVLGSIDFFPCIFHSIHIAHLLEYVLWLIIVISSFIFHICFKTLILVDANTYIHTSVDQDRILLILRMQCTRLIELDISQWFHAYYSSSSLLNSSFDLVFFLFA